ncbi:MAG: peptidase M42, partial [Gammaproteobacteria bacterium]|nr:peptidase M42 [Gammaproteobacteria bacterium]
MILDSSFIDLLKSLMRSASVVGAEHSFFRVLQRELEERQAKVTWYEGVLVAQGRNPSSVMYSAHIDRHGLICTGPHEFQFAAFVAANRTDLLQNSVSEEMMNRVTERFNGEKVYAYEPWSGGYLGKGVITNAYVCEYRNNLIFEINGLGDVVAGTPVAFKDQLVIEGDRLEGQIDNVLSAAVLVHLFSLGFGGTAFFTAQEEAGKSWRFLLEWFRRFGGRTNRLFVVDTSPFPTRESANEQLLVLRQKDANALFNRTSTAYIESLCRECGYSYLYKDLFMEGENEKRRQQGRASRSIGSTEMGRVISASGGLVEGTTIQIPTVGYHTLRESASVASVAAFITLLQRLAQDIEGI